MNFESVKTYLQDHSNTLLGALGIGAFVAAVPLAIKASIKSTDRLNDLANEHGYPNRQEYIRATPAKVVFGEIWKYYIKAGIAVIGGVTFEVLSMKDSNNKIRAEDLLYTSTAEAYWLYKETVKEQLGETKERHIEEKAAQKRVDEHPVSNVIVVPGDGDVLCMLAPTNTYFKSSIDKIRRAEIPISKHMHNDIFMSMNEVNDFIGVKAVAGGDSVGWDINHDGEVEFRFDTALADDGVTPCIVVDYVTQPHPNFKCYR